MAAVLTEDMRYVSFPIDVSKTEETDEGLVIYGKASDGRVDSDDQIVAPDWSGPAIAKWLDTGANLRVQHNPQLYPAGKGLAVEIDKDGDGAHWVRSLVVEPTAIKLVRAGVLRAYSVGIAKPVIRRDITGKARGGIVAGGEIAEISLVDRPANSGCAITLVKSEGDAEPWTHGDLVDALVKAEAAGLVEKAAKDAEPDEKPEPAEDGKPEPDEDDKDGEGKPEGGSDDKPKGDAGDHGNGGTMARQDSAVQEGDEDDEDPVRKAYQAARSGWLAREPRPLDDGTPTNGTAFLAKHAARDAWNLWDAEGDVEGFHDEVAGLAQWVAKRDFDPGVGGGVDRDTLDDSDFAGPGRSFPIVTPGDVSDAAGLAGHAGNPGRVRRRIRELAHAKGPEFVAQLPDSWSDKNITTSSPLASGLVPYNLAGAGKDDEDEKDDVAVPDLVKADSGGCPKCGNTNYDEDHPPKRCPKCGKKLRKMLAKYSAVAMLLKAEVHHWKHGWIPLDAFARDSLAHMHMQKHHEEMAKGEWEKAATRLHQASDALAPNGVYVPGDHNDIHREVRSKLDAQGLAMARTAGAPRGKVTPAQKKFHETAAQAHMAAGQGSHNIAAAHAADAEAASKRLARRAGKPKTSEVKPEPGSFIGNVPATHGNARPGNQNSRGEGFSVGDRVRHVDHPGGGTVVQHPRTPRGGTTVEWDKPGNGPAVEHYDPDQLKPFRGRGAAKPKPDDSRLGRALRDHDADLHRQRAHEDAILRAAEHPQALPHTREVAAQIQDHRDAGNYTTMGNLSADTPGAQAGRELGHAMAGPGPKPGKEKRPGVDEWAGRPRTAWQKDARAAGVKPARGAPAHEIARVVGEHHTRQAATNHHVVSNLGAGGNPEHAANRAVAEFNARHDEKVRMSGLTDRRGLTAADHGEMLNHMGAMGNQSPERSNHNLMDQAAEELAADRAAGRPTFTQRRDAKRAEIDAKRQARYEAGHGSDRPYTPPSFEMTPEARSAMGQSPQFRAQRRTQAEAARAHIEGAGTGTGGHLQATEHAADVRAAAAVSQGAVTPGSLAERTGALFDRLQGSKSKAAMRREMRYASMADLTGIAQSLGLRGGDRKNLEAAIANHLIVAVAAKRGMTRIKTAGVDMTKSAPPASDGKRLLPPGVDPAGPHREPDGSQVEELEADAHMQEPGEAPETPDRIPASMKSYGGQRMHDALCPAYDWDAVTTTYPALKSVTDAIDTDWFTQAVLKASGEGDATGIVLAGVLHENADALVKGAIEPSMLADARADLHKAFNAPPTPDQFQRPYIAAGHAPLSAPAVRVPMIPPAVHTISPDDFHRGLITEGHQAESPGDRGNNLDTGGTLRSGASRTFYQNASRAAASATMKALHDHISATIPGMCPMADSRLVMPPDMQAGNRPHPVAPLVTEVPGSNKSIDGDTVPMLSKKRLAKLVKSAVADATSEMQDQIAALEAELDEMGAQPDPTQAPVRGAVMVNKAATLGEDATPVERVSLVEKAQRDAATAFEEEVAYTARLLHSPNAQTRLSAEAHLRKLIAQP